MPRHISSLTIATIVLLALQPVNAATLDLVFNTNLTNATDINYNNISTLSNSLATAEFTDLANGDVELTLKNLNSSFFQTANKTGPTYIASIMISTDLQGSVNGGIDGPLLNVHANNTSGYSAQSSKFESPEDLRDLNGYYFSSELTLGIPSNTTCSVPCSDTALRQGDTLVEDFTGFHVSDLTPAWIFSQSTFDSDAIANAGDTTDYGKPLDGPQSNYYAALKVRQFGGITGGISVDSISTIVVGGQVATVPLPSSLPLMLSAITGFGLLSGHKNRWKKV